VIVFEPYRNRPEDVQLNCPSLEPPDHLGELADEGPEFLFPITIGLDKFRLSTSPTLQRAIGASAWLLNE
jgi:hypothetical protein